MTEHPTALEILQRQIAELDSILTLSHQDLNVIRGGERVAHWKRRTVPLIAEHIGPAAAKQLADKQPGPSFSQDLFEELSDEIEAYRDVLMALINDLKRG
jgi:hypothetical protein